MNPKYAVTFGKLCWQAKPDEPAYRCSKEMNHTGDHEYSDGAVTKTWPREGELR